MLKRRIFAASLASVLALSSFSVSAFAEDVKADLGKEVVSKADLKKLVESFAAFKENDLYDYGSIQGRQFLDALEYGERVVNDTDADNDDATAAYQMIKAVFNKLRKWSVEELKGLMDSCKPNIDRGNVLTIGEYDLKWTDESYTDFVNAYDDAETAVNSGDGRVVCDAYMELDVKKNLVEKKTVTKTQFNQAIQAFKAAMNPLKYDSWRRGKINGLDASSFLTDVDYKAYNGYATSYGALYSHLNAAYDAIITEYETFTTRKTISVTSNEDTVGMYNVCKDITTIINSFEPDDTKSARKETIQTTLNKYWTRLVYDYGEDDVIAIMKAIEDVAGLKFDLANDTDGKVKQGLERATAFGFKNDDGYFTFSGDASSTFDRTGAADTGTDTLKITDYFKTEVNDKGKRVSAAIDLKNTTALTFGVDGNGKIFTVGSGGDTQYAIGSSKATAIASVLDGATELKGIKDDSGLQFTGEDSDTADVDTILGAIGTARDDLISAWADLQDSTKYSDTTKKFSDDKGKGGFVNGKYTKYTANNLKGDGKFNDKSDDSTSDGGLVGLYNTAVDAYDTALTALEKALEYNKTKTPDGLKTFKTFSPNSKFELAQFVPLEITDVNAEAYGTPGAVSNTKQSVSENSAYSKGTVDFGYMLAVENDGANNVVDGVAANKKNKEYFGQNNDPFYDLIANTLTGSDVTSSNVNSGISFDGTEKNKNTVDLTTAFTMAKHYLNDDIDEVTPILTSAIDTHGEFSALKSENVDADGHYTYTLRRSAVEYTLVNRYLTYALTDKYADPEAATGHTRADVRKLLDDSNKLLDLTEGASIFSDEHIALVRDTENTQQWYNAAIADKGYKEYIYDVSYRVQNVSSMEVKTSNKAYDDLKKTYDALKKKYDAYKYSFGEIADYIALSSKKADELGAERAAVLINAIDDCAYYLSIIEPEEIDGLVDTENAAFTNDRVFQPINRLHTADSAAFYHVSLTSAYEALKSAYESLTSPTTTKGDVTGQRGNRRGQLH